MGEDVILYGSHSMGVEELNVAEVVVDVLNVDVMDVLVHRVVVVVYSYVVVILIWNQG